MSTNRLRVAPPARASTAVADDTERQAKTSKVDVGSWNGQAGTKRLAHLEVASPLPSLRVAELGSRHTPCSRIWHVAHMSDCLVLSGQEQARSALTAAMENFEHPAFPCALIMGDVVILELLHREGLLQSGRMPVIFVDTFHLFPETHTLLHKLEVCRIQNTGAIAVCPHLS